LPPGGKWSPNEFLALTTLIEDRGGRYQICGPSAFSRYGWDDQVPNRLYAYNNRISGERKIGSAAMTLIKLTDERLGETEVVKTPDGIEAVYSSRVRSLVDAVYDWSTACREVTIGFVPIWPAIRGSLRRLFELPCDTLT
jgi:hypothetical protein